MTYIKRIFTVTAQQTVINVVTVILAEVIATAEDHLEKPHHKQ